MSLLSRGVSKLAGLDVTIRQVAHPSSNPNLDKSAKQSSTFLHDGIVWGVTNQTVDVVHCHVLRTPNLNWSGANSVSVAPLNLQGLAA